MIELLTGGSKSYPACASLVFSDLSLSMEEGTCLALMGPNACGKSTLLSCLLGLTPLDQGRVALRMTARDLLGVVVQDYRSLLLPWASVRTNLLLPLGGERDPGVSPETVVASASDCFSLLGYQIDLDAQCGSFLAAGSRLSFSLGHCPSAPASSSGTNRPVPSIYPGGGHCTTCWKPVGTTPAQRCCS